MRVVFVLLLLAQDKLRQDYEEKKAHATQNAQGQFELGKWCDMKGLREEAVKAYERAVEIDPEFEPARKALGHKMVRGRWVSEKKYADSSWWAHPKVDQKKVDDAIVKGTEFLLKIDRYPVLKHKNLRYDELVLLTVLESGIDRKDPRVQKLIQHVLKLPLDRTYHVSVRALCLAALDPMKYQPQLAQCAQFLVDNQCESGQWTYGEPVSMPPTFRPIKEPVKGLEVRRGKSTAEKTGDNSNSQYAALGIRACLSGLVVVPKETVHAAEQWWESSQNTDGGWGYDDPRFDKVAKNPDRSWGSMSAGAVGALAIYKYYRKRVWGESMDGASVKRGVAWVAENLTFSKNPKHGVNGFQYYWLYAIERAGRLLETETFGSTEWYPEGALPLLSRQQPNGAWPAETWTVPKIIEAFFKKDDLQPGSIAETCFAILFLSRATPKLADTIKTTPGSK
jgi:hypothetical protein